MNYIMINPTDPGLWYSLFYVLAFLTGFVMLVLEGRRRGYPALPWLIVIGTGFLFFIIGCRVVHWSPADWQYVLAFQPIPRATGMSILGGIALMVPGILLAKYVLRFKHDVVDTFAYVLPVAVLIERFGCLMAGCCFGTPTNLPWAVAYGAHSHTFAKQVGDGVLSCDAMQSLAVHPVQLYEALGCLIMILALARIRRRFQVPGNLALTSLTFYGIVRFGLEFFRGDAGKYHFLGLDIVQWVLVLTLLLIVLIVSRREKFQTPSQSQAGNSSPAWIIAFSVFFLVSLLWISSRWLGITEIVAMNIVFLPLLGLVAWHLFRRATIPGFRLASVFLPCMALMMMSQTFPEFSAKDSTKLSYTTISLGYLGGYSNLHYEQQGCNGSNTIYDFAHNFAATGIGISHTAQKSRYNSLTWGISGFSGSHQVDGRGTNVVSSANFAIGKNYSYYAAMPYLQYDMKYFGFGLGLSVGQMGTMNPAGNQNPVTTTNVFPAVYFRGGSLARWYGEFRLGYNFPTAFPALGGQIALGHGFNKRNGAALRIGTGTNTSFFIAPTIPAGNHVIIEPYFGYGPGLNSGTSDNKSSGDGFIGAVNLHFKLGRKEIK